jgi:DNA polymerase
MPEQALRLKTSPEQWRCTSVHALSLGMPGNLADVGLVANLPAEQRKGSGFLNIRFFAMPCAPTKANEGRTRNLPHHAPEKWLEFKRYCMQDVVTERSIERRLAKFPVPEIEHRFWQLDQQMNTHGIKVDLDLVTQAIALGDQVREKLIAEAIEITGLENPNSRNQLLAWLQRTEEVSDLNKKTLPLILKNTREHSVRRVIEIRQALAKTSVSKYAAIQRAVCADGRVRGMFRFFGANRTGRFAGQLVQLQNLPRNELKDLHLARELVKAGDLETLETVFVSVPDTLSQLIRTAFVGPFVVADFSAIEARVIAWLANCKWRLEVFASHGKIYEASAEQMFRLPKGSVDKKSPYRQKGKIAELALGYAGGVGALKVMGALAMGLKEDELEGIKVAWREANKEIVRFWHRVEGAAHRAVLERKPQRVPIGQSSELIFTWESSILFIELPSGRRMAYAKPRIEAKDLMRDDIVIARAGSLTYEGTDQRTKQWGRISTFGGKLVENVTQAIARDCLREAMLAIAQAGYQQVMSIHDEIVIESDTGLDEVLAIMRRPLSWAPGLELRGDGFVTPYYQKESD